MGGRSAVVDPRQGALFASQPARQVSKGIVYFDREWRGHMARAIRESGKSREQIAAEMEDLLGSDPDYPISKALLDAWTAPSRTDYRFTLIYLPEFITATGADWLFDLLAQRCGRIAVTEVEAQLLEVSRLKRALVEGNRRLRKLLHGQTSR